MADEKRRKVTIRDIADVVGVHHSTVSRALSPVKRDKISPEVVQKVERTAKKLGYYPNLVASSLKQNRSFAVGVLTLLGVMLGSLVFGFAYPALEGFYESSSMGVVPGGSSRSSSSMAMV